MAAPLFCLPHSRVVGFPFVVERKREGSAVGEQPTRIGGGAIGFAGRIRNRDAADGGSIPILRHEAHVSLPLVDGTESEDGEREVCGAHIR